MGELFFMVAFLPAVLVGRILLEVWLGHDK